MQKFYINTVTGTWYNSDGDLFRDGMPEYTYQNSYRIAIQLCSSTPSSATEGVNPEEWEKYTGYSAGGVTALLSADNDFRRRRKGTVVGEIPAGAVSQIAMDIESASSATIRSSGTLRLFNASGVAEVLKYDSVSISGETVTFSISSGSVLENSYPDGAAGDVPDAIYAQAAMIAEESDPANGLFVFDFVIYSEKLREKFEYADLETLDDLKGIELLIFSLDGDTADIHDRYFCKSCSIKAPMAEPGLLTEIPDSCSGNLASMITALISNGFDVEFSADGDSWHTEQLEDDSFMRFRLKVVGESGEWIVVQLKAGPANTLTIGTVTTGEPGTQAAATITGESPNQVLNLTIPRGQQGAAGSVAWEDVTGKPSTFPPSTHQHAISDVTGLQDALDNAGAVKTVNGVGPDESGNVALTSRADLEFTSASLSANVLMVENATIAGLVVLDSDGMQQLPEMTQSGTGVAINFAGWTIYGTWRVQFSNVLAASGTPDYYTKAEIDAKFGTFEAEATAVIGEA